MKFSPAISVIMPVYNCVSFIEEAVNSILNQTFANFELIIIDDASTDGTSDILKNFTDPRIKFVFKEVNQGVSTATNEGFRLAKGKYIARMDGDDISVKERFEKQVGILETNPEIFICGGFVKYLGGSNSIIVYKETHQEIVTGLLLSNSICMGVSMFRRKELSHCFYDQNKKSGEDYDFWTKVAWLGEMYNIQEVLLLYRVHPNQASIAHKPQQILDDIKIRLYLFKKINYDTKIYTDEFISKMLLLNEPITIKEFDLFLKWIEELVKLNSKSKVYPQKELQNVLQRIKRILLFSLYFKKSAIGISKLWRFTALLKLPINDALYVLKLKSKEIIKAKVKI
ncbi:glycosyltransferase family 2 protein [Flavobacterium sp. GT2N3]|uniref:glycosyltransferase family 2 protein n=1 Tax=unclassified Flavobacterium TaxID=196869 RepID=UPI003AB0FA77